MAALSPVSLTTLVAQLENINKGIRSRSRGRTTNSGREPPDPSSPNALSRGGTSNGATVLRDTFHQMRSQAQATRPSQLLLHPGATRVGLRAVGTKRS